MTTQRTAGPTVSAWVGWLWFAAVMLLTLGMFQVFQGIIALVDDTFTVLVGEQLLIVDLTAWAWAHLIMGVLLVVAAIGVLSGTMWGRTLGVIIAALNILAQLAILSVYPIWALIVVALDTFIIYALVVHGAEAKAI